MAGLNLEHLLNDISPESPCGENLEEDTDFLKLENEAKFVEERQMGKTILPAEEPDWKTVRSLALGLLERSHDIQVVLPLTCALLRSDGFNGLNQGLTLIQTWLEEHWDTVYPLQDPEDDYPMLRVNTISALNDYKLIRGTVNQVPLIHSKLGSFCWRDIEIAEGKIPPIKDEKPLEMSVVDAVFNDEEISIDVLQNLDQSVKQSLQKIQGITAIMIDKVGAEEAPDLSDVTSLLQGIARFVGEKYQQRKLLEGDGEEEEVGGATENTGEGKKAVRLTGIHERKDVIRAIDEICKYFERYEPSSPVPLLLLRAKKLLAMSFMDILREMTPDAVNQAENICGVQDDTKS